MRVWTWPPELADDLVAFCVALLRRATCGGGDAACAAHGYNSATGSFRVRPVVNVGEDICSACAVAMLDHLRLDYKCIDLRHGGSVP